MSSDPQKALRNAMAAARRRHTVVQAHISNGAACIDADSMLALVEEPQGGEQ